MQHGAHRARAAAGPGGSAQGVPRGKTLLPLNLASPPSRTAIDFRFWFSGGRHG